MSRLVVPQFDPYKEAIDGPVKDVWAGVRQRESRSAAPLPSVLDEKPTVPHVDQVRERRGAGFWIATAMMLLALGLFVWAMVIGS